MYTLDITPNGTYITYLCWGFDAENWYINKVNYKKF